ATLDNSAGTFSVGSLTVSAGAFKLAGGTLALGGAGTVDTNGAFTFSGGTFQSGSLTVNGALTWSGGTMSGGSITVANGYTHTNSVSLTGGNFTVATAGVVSLRGLTTGTGTFDTGSAAAGQGTIRVDGGVLNLNDGSKVVGTGTFQVNNGSAIVNVNAAVPASTFNLTFGTLQGPGA